IVVQNYLVPLLERSVLRAARSQGCRTVAVVHNHVPHSVLGGVPGGLRSWLAAADEIVVHSHFVGQRLPGRPRYTQIPLPPHFRVLESRGGRPIVEPQGELLALHFGVLKRRYKNTGVVLDLARRGVPGWRFAFAGVGAPPPESGISSTNEFVDSADLRATL